MRYRDIIQKSIDVSEQKIKDLCQWLNDHPTHPDRIKILGDLRAEQVSRSTSERKLENMDRGLPTLGDEFPPRHDANEKKPHRTDQ